LADRPDVSVIKRGMSIIHGNAAIASLVAANLAVAQTACRSLIFRPAPSSSSAQPQGSGRDRDHRQLSF